MDNGQTVGWKLLRKFDNGQTAGGHFRKLNNEQIPGWTSDSETARQRTGRWEDARQSGE